MSKAKASQPMAAVPQKQQTLGVGIHPGVTRAEYERIEAVNNTRLGWFGKTAAHAHYRMTHPEEDTDALRLGDAVHAAVLEPERFARQYVAAPKFDKRTNAGKLESAAWMEANAFKCALTAAEHALASAIRDAVWAQPLASELLKGPGQNEMTAIWTDAETGLLCKGRIDRFTKFQNSTMVLDLKTTKDEATPAEWGKSCAKFHCHRQAAFYLDGLNAISPRQRRFVHIVVEKEPPYCLALMELDDSALAEGRAQYRRALALYKKCTETGEWPGYPVGIYGMDIPHWAYELTSPPK
jgi:hypothetical protein